MSAEAVTLEDAVAGLAERIAGAAPEVVVIGLGHVGLPLAAAMAATGARVTGIDTSSDVVRRLGDGRSHVGDVPDALLGSLCAGAGAKLSFSSEPAALAEADAVVICVPTPLHDDGEPDLSCVRDAVSAVAEHARPGQLLVLESTTYPGTTRDVLVPALRARGLEPGRDTCVAFAPERIDPGNRRYALRNTPKIVGGVTPRCAAAARALYGRTCDRVVEVSSPEAAEMAKLLENTFRSVNIALVNELAIIARRMGIDIWEVVDAASTKPFGFMRFDPGPGTGGHCIPVDPMYLAWQARRLGLRAGLAELANDVNRAMPAHVVGILEDTLAESGRGLAGARILVLGVAYKPDVSDCRESPSLAVIERLARAGADVAYHDPFVPRLAIASRTLESAPLHGSGRYDAAVLLTPHSEIDAAAALETCDVLVDARNATHALRRADPAAAARIRGL